MKKFAVMLFAGVAALVLGAAEMDVYVFSSLQLIARSLYPFISL